MLQYHIKEECTSNANFVRDTHQIGDVVCPVKDLVPVNGYTSSVDSGENWDDVSVALLILNSLVNNSIF